MYWVREEKPFVDRKGRNRSECAQVYILSRCDLRVMRQGANPGREVADSINYVLWEEPLTQTSEIEPLVRRAPQSAVVQVETVNVDVGGQNAPDMRRPPKGRPSLPTTEAEWGDHW